MKKKVLLILIIFLMTFTLLGCGKESNKKEEKITRDEIEKLINDSDTSSDSEINLYSDDTKIVFENGNSKLVFYYSGNEITAYHSYIDYGDSVTAKYALKVLENGDNIDKIYTKGKYLVIEYDKSQYETLTLDEVKLTYSYLEELKKQN